MIRNAFLTVLSFTPWVSVFIAALLLLRRTRLPAAARFYRAAFLILALRCALPVSLALPQLATQARLPSVQIELPAAPAAQPQTETSANTITAYVKSPSRPAPGDDANTAADAANPPTLTENEPAYSYQDFTSYTLQPADSVLPFTLAQLTDLGAAVWAMGAAAVFGWRLLCWARFSADLRRSRRAITEPALCSLATEAFGRPMRLFRSDKLAGPALAGLFRPAVYLNPDALTVRQLRVVLAHEAAHAKRQDIACKWLLSAACAVCWFNPLVFYMSAAAAQEMERACDEDVLRSQDLEFCKFYGSTILDTLKSGRSSAFSTQFTGSAKQIKSRFVSMFDRRKKHSLLPVLALLLAAVVLAGSLISCTTAPAVFSSGADAPAASAPVFTDEILQNVSYPRRDRAFRSYSVNEATGQSVYSLQTGDFGAATMAEAPAPALPDGFTERSGINTAPGCHVSGTGLWFAAFLNDTDSETELYLARTEDDGAAWTGRTVRLTDQLPDGPAAFVLDHEFLNADTGYLTLQMQSGQLCILRTQNGGESWELLYTGRMNFVPESDSFSEENRVVRDVRFVNETVGFASVYASFSEAPAVMQTTDGGKSWQAADLSGAADSEFSRYRACCIVINGAEVEIRCFTDASPTQENVVFTTGDLGRHWRFGLREWYANSTSNAFSWEKAGFFGDSLSIDWATYSTGIAAQQVVAGAYPPPKKGENWEDRTTHESYDPIERVVSLSPRYLFLQFGTNLLAGSGDAAAEDELIDRYTALIDTLHEQLPKTTLYLQSILLTSQDKTGSDSLFNKNLTAERLLSVNSRLAQLADETGCVYLDANSALCEGNNRKAEYTAADGIHVTPEGYTAWKEYLTDAVTLAQQTAAAQPDASKLLFPVAADGYDKISRGFSDADDHTGLDISGTAGTKILAAAAGVVTRTEPDGTTGEGIWCEISHGSGLVTRYSHCADLTVSVGQTVSEGDVIAHLGSTGNSTGPHLHFQVLKYGAAVDPLPYLTDSAAASSANSDFLYFRF